VLSVRLWLSVKVYGNVWPRSCAGAGVVWYRRAMLLFVVVLGLLSLHGLVCLGSVRFAGVCC
jgi:hypothetical protein